MCGLGSEMTKSTTEGWVVGRSSTRIYWALNSGYCQLSSNSWPLFIL